MYHYIQYTLQGAFFQLFSPGFDRHILLNISPQQFLHHLLRRIHKPLRHNIVLRVFVVDRADSVFGYFQHFCVRESHQNRRMCGNDKLRILLHQLLHANHQPHESHRRQRRLRLVQYVQSVSPETVFHQRHKLSPCDCLCKDIPP